MVNRQDLQNMGDALLRMACVMQSIETKPRLTKDDKEKLLEAWYNVTEYRDQEGKRVRVWEKVEAVLELENDYASVDDDSLFQIISDYGKSIEEKQKEWMDAWVQRHQPESQSEPRLSSGWCEDVESCQKETV